jgi:hypothetical protein
MSDEKVKMLPAAALDDQVKLKSYGHFAQGPFSDEEGRQELRAESGDDSRNDALYMSIDRAGNAEYVTAGADDYEALKKLTEPDLEDRAWVENTEYDSAGDIPSPTNEEIEDLRGRYEERLEDAATEAEEREVLQEMWDEAAEMELEGRDPFGR